MSYLKNDLIQKIYKNNYHCKQGHMISWKGKTYIFSSTLICDKCGKKSELKNPIRWNCSQCNTYFCTKCYDIIIDKFCPVKHKLKFYKQSSLDSSSTYTCDKCSQSKKHNDGVLFDKDCNITICPRCFCDCCDIPEILED